jgi:hypothetical protein
MTVPPNDQAAYEQALSSFYEAIDLGGVGVISQASRDAERRALRTLIARYPEEAEKDLAEWKALRGGGRGGAKRWIDRTGAPGGGGPGAPETAAAHGSDGAHPGPRSP